MYNAHRRSGKVKLQQRAQEENALRNGHYLPEKGSLYLTLTALWIGSKLPLPLYLLLLLSLHMRAGITHLGQNQY